MDQLIIIIKKMIEINNERVVDFYHIIGVIVFDKLHIDHQKEDYKHSLTIAKILAKMFKITLNIEIFQVKIEL